MGNFLEMYLRIPITISNLLGTNYFDMHDLKLIEIYDKTKMEVVVIQANASFHVENPFPLGFKVPISEFEDQWVPFLCRNMPLICFQCGHLGYHLKDCKVTVGHDEETSGNEMTYPPRIKLSPRTLENRQILFHAFVNSTKYIRYNQLSQLII